MLKPFRFLSLVTLLLVAFSLVLLPLLFALGSAWYSLEKLVSDSQRVVYQSVRLTHGSRILLEQLLAMERSARQYLVLADSALIENYHRA
jgi:two-component system sensor histidine kinase GlrK